MTRRMGGLILALCLVAAPAPAAAPPPQGSEGPVAEQWPGWRGPRGDGTSAETGIPDVWGPKENVRWKTPIPGIGHSSPIVWGDRVFVTTCIEDDKDEGDRKLLCLDRADGRVVWDRVVVPKAKLEKKHRLNSYSSSTPATDGKHVYVAFLDDPNMVVVCYDFDGNEVWRKSPGKFHSVHGFCTSPVLYKDLVILNGDQDAVGLHRGAGQEHRRREVARPTGPTARAPTARRS